MEVVVGDRVESVDGARAFARWTGEVEGRAGTWIGVEWDDETRGKHDGVVDGKRLFTCARKSACDGGARTASLVRPHKIASSRTFAQAFRARYARGLDDGEEAANDMYIRTERGHKMRVELCETVEEANVNEEAIRSRLKSMTRVYVDHARVSTMGERGEASAWAGPLRILGLAGSLFNSWEGVMRIAEEFPSLEALDLSGIRLPSWSAAGTSTFPKLRVLVLNDANVTWSDVRAISSQVPELEELYIHGNRLSCFSVGEREPTAFRKLRTLSIDGNVVSDWDAMEALGRQLPWLESLYVSQNLLTEIRPTSAFPSLKTLLVGDNKIRDWSSVDALNSFPLLQEVRLTGNPVAEAVEMSVRYEIIARVQGLTLLNGSVVSASERKDCEIRYLRKALQKLKGFFADAAGQARVRDEHPRIDALVARHGDLVTHAASAQGNGTLASVSVELILRLEASGQTMTRKLPKSTTVGKVKLLCSKLFKHSVDTADLYLVNDGATDRRVPLAPDDEPLARFSPIDGSRIDIVSA